MQKKVASAIMAIFPEKPKFWTHSNSFVSEFDLINQRNACFLDIFGRQTLARKFWNYIILMIICSCMHIVDMSCIYRHRLKQFFFRSIFMQKWFAETCECYSQRNSIWMWIMFEKVFVQRKSKGTCQRSPWKSEISLLPVFKSIFTQSWNVDSCQSYPWRSEIWLHYLWQILFRFSKLESA